MNLRRSVHSDTMWPRKSICRSIKFIQINQQYSEMVSNLTILVWLRQWRDNGDWFRGQQNVGVELQSGEKLWPRLCGQHRALVRVYGICAKHIRQTRNSCRSIRYVFCTLKVKGADTRLDDSRTGYDTRRRGTNHCRPFPDSCMTEDGGIIAEVSMYTQRSSSARWTEVVMKPVFLHRWIVGYTAPLCSVVLCDCEAWGLRVENVCRFEVFHNRSLPSVAKIWRNDRVSDG